MFHPSCLCLIFHSMNPGGDDVDLLFFGIVPCVTSIRDASIISIEKLRGTGKFHKFSIPFDETIVSPDEIML
jgi:hypothetical protein